MLSKCVQCGFYVRKNDEFCLNCGRKNSGAKKIVLPKKKNYRRLFSLIVVLTGIFLIVISGLEIQSTFVWIFLSLVFGILSGIWLNYFIEKQENEARLHSLKPKRYFGLVKKENVINGRLAELTKRLNRVDHVLHRVSQTSNQNLSQVKQKLLSAREIAFEQFSKYKLQKNKIELVRLQNQVLPYSLYFNRLDEFKTEEAVIISEQTIREVGKIREDLAENFSNKDDFEFKNFMQNLDETSNGCEKLWEALLNKQAIFALKDVQPLENLNALPQTNELAHTIETFNIESTLNDFSESFEQLEAEYKRLLTDNEISQKLLNYEN